MKRYLKELLILLAVFGGLPLDVASDTAYAQTKPLRLNGVLFGTADKSQFAPVYGCKADGASDDSSCINTGAAAVGAGVFYLPATAASYKIGTTTINVPSGVVLEGTARNGTSIVYTGTGCAISLDSTDSSGLRNIYVQVNSSSATAVGICIKNTTGDSKWNRFENVKVIQTNTPTTPVAGQVGILFDGSAGALHALYWNRLDQVTLGGWDKAIKMTGSIGSLNGPNANTFVDVMIYASQHGVSLEAYATENVFSSLMCSASGFGGTECVKIGDGSHPANYNAFYGVTSDQGVGPATYTVAAGVTGNRLEVNSQSSLTGTDAGTGTIIEELLTSTINWGKFNPAQFVVTQPASTSGVPHALQVVAGAHTTLSNAEDIDVLFDLSATSNITGGGTLSLMRAFGIQPRTYTATAPTTVTNAATLDIVGPPVCSTNMTCTNAWALQVEAGQSKFNNTIVGTLAQMSTGVQVATGGVYDSYNGSATIGVGTTNVTTLNQGKAGAAWTENGLLQNGLPAKANNTIASATTIAPTAFITHITGTTTLQTMTAPTNFAQTNGGGCLVLVFDGIAPWNAAGNFFVAGTPTTAGTNVQFCYDNATLKWYPSRTL